MSINRYKLRHRARIGHRGAVLANRLLERPDRLIGLILLGNNLVNILASMLTTIIALRIYPGEGGLAIAAGILTLVILVFAEVTPKTWAAIHPETIAYPAAFIYTPLLKITYPIVAVVNLITNNLLKLFGVSAAQTGNISLSREEFSTVVKEAGARLSKRHQNMLLNVLQLEETTVEDIMVPRNEVVGIDLQDDWDEIVNQLNHTTHTRIPIYRENIDQVIGIIHLKRILPLIAKEEFDEDAFIEAMAPAYFVPEGTQLTTQLLNFQSQKRRLALVVDEYGDLLGLITLEDILEEIVGKFTTDSAASIKDIYPQPDGSVLVDGGVHIRDVNKALDWSLPTDGPKTLNGMILEYMEMIPEKGTSLLLHQLPVEIIKTHKNAIKLVRVFPNKRQQSTPTESEQLPNG